MELLKELEKVKEIKHAYELLYLVNSINKENKNTQINMNFKRFLKTTIVLIMSKPPQFETKEDFLEKIKSIKNKNNGETKNIMQIINTHINNNLKKDLVEVKGLENNSLNSNNFNISPKIMLGENFETLKKNVGDEVFKYFLENTSFLVKSDDIYIQVFGTPISNFFNHKNLLKTFESRNVTYKNNTNNNLELVPETILDQYVDRNLFMYCLHSNKKVDFFHKSFFYQVKKEIKSSQNPTKKITKAFVSTKIKDKINKFFEIIFEKFKINEATRNKLKTILNKILKNYVLFDMNKLFRRTCSFEIEKYSNCKEKYQEIRKMIKTGNAREDPEITKKFQETFSILTEMTVEPSSVYLFLKRVANSIFPSDYFGHENMQTIYAYIKKVVFMKRFETFTYKEIYTNMCMKKIPWFSRGFHPLFKKEINSKKRSIMLFMLKFFFENIISLMKCNFYVTEKHNKNNELFFYSKSVWHLITQLGTLQLEVQNLDRKKTIKNFQFDSPMAKLRFVPKNNSLRPIMTFYKKFKDPKTKKFVKAKNFLHPVKIVLRSVKQTLFEKSGGFAVFDNHQIFQRIEKFVEEWEDKKRPELFAACLDIKQCYDSVNLNKMFEFLKKDDKVEQVYLINNFFKIMRNKRYHFDGDEEVKISNKFLGKRRDTSNTMSELCNLNTYFKDKIILPNETIFIDNGQKYLYTKKEIKEKIEFICNQVYVKFGKSYFKLNRGLPQGLSVSAVLSSYYYSKLEEKATESFMDNIKSKNILFMVLRLTDDYLIISEDKKCVKNFYDILHKTSSENNFKFNEQKLKSNFFIKGFDSQDKNKNFQWIGKIFDLEKLEVQHTQILDPREAFYTVNINFPSEIKLIPDFIKGKFKTFLLNQNTYYFSTSINSDEKILHILPDMIESAFLKLNTYLNSLGDDTRYKNIINIKFANKIAYKINDTIKDCSIHICNKRKIKSEHIQNKIREIIIQKLEGKRNNKLKNFIYKKMVSFK